MGIGTNPLKPRPVYIKELISGDVIKYDSRYKAAKYYNITGSAISNGLGESINQTFINSDVGILLASTTNSFKDVEGVEIIGKFLDVKTFIPFSRCATKEIARALNISNESAKYINSQIKEFKDHTDNAKGCFVPNEDNKPSGQDRAVMLKRATR